MNYEEKYKKTINTIVYILLNIFFSVYKSYLSFSSGMET